MRHRIVCGLMATVFTFSCFGQSVNAPLQVGGDVSAPKLLKHPDAHAPANSGAGEETGQAEIQIVIDNKGKVASAHLSKSSGSSEFDSNALKAASNYVFEPAQQNGRPVAVQITVSMNFRTHRIR